jgi:hypothetical protein
MLSERPVDKDFFHADAEEQVPGLATYAGRSSHIIERDQEYHPDIFGRTGSRKTM